MVAGRATGLAWTLLLVASLGLGEYGQYATAYASAAILSAPIENIFVVRAMRVPDAVFRAERSMRLLIGLGASAVGLALYPLSFVVGFGLTIAGVEMVFNAYKSTSLRAGRPDAVMRADAMRQITSIGAATLAIRLLGESRSLSMVCLAYLLPYAVVIVIAIAQSWRTRPRWPAAMRNQLLLVADALVLSVYLQGDILLLGLLFSDDVVGAYAIASQLVLAASVVGQLFGQQYAERLRMARGHPDSGAPMTMTFALGLVIAAGGVALGVVLALVPSTHDVGVVLIALAPFGGLRAITNTWVTALYIRHLDAERVLWSALALGLRFCAFLGLVSCTVAGGMSAAIAAVLGECLLTLAFFRLVRRPVAAPDRGTDG